jgi:hypothetical protein
MFGSADNLGSPPRSGSRAWSSPWSQPQPAGSNPSDASVSPPGGDGPNTGLNSATAPPAGQPGSSNGSSAPTSTIFQSPNGASPGAATSQGSSLTPQTRSRPQNPEFAAGDSLQFVHIQYGDPTGGETVAGANPNAGGPLVAAILSVPIPPAEALTAAPSGALRNIDLAANSRTEPPGEGHSNGDRVADAGPFFSPHSAIGLRSTTGASAAAPRSRTPVAPARAVEAQAGDFPQPLADDLIAVALPFDGAMVQRAIDHFFQEFDELDPRDLVRSDLSGVVYVSLGLATTVAAMEVVRRRLRHRTLGANAVLVREARSSGDDLGFPDLPGSWSSRLT